MLIIRMWCGLGNQMFIYAYYRAMHEKGIIAKLDTSFFEFVSGHGEEYVVPNIFPNTNNVYATNWECKYFTKFRNKNLRRTIRKYWTRRKRDISQTQKPTG